MFKNYLYLLRTVHELNSALLGSEITDIYSQEKNLLFFKIPGNEFPDRHLIISTNPQSPYLLIKNRHHKAKKNVVDIFKGFLPFTISNIEIADNDRVLKINFGNNNIYFSARGNKTNVHLIDESNKEIAFKKTSNFISSEIADLTFTNELLFKRLNYEEEFFNDFSELKKNYPMISSEIKNEIIFRSSQSEKQNVLELFKEIVYDILFGNIRVGYNVDLKKVVFVPDAFLSLATDEHSKLFTDINSALNYYIGSFYRETAKKDISKELDKYFDKELSSLANKLNKLSARVEAGSKDNLYYRQGNALLTNIYRLKKGMKEIIINDNASEEKLVIILDPKLKPKDNIDKYFEKAKDEKVNFKKSTELFNFTKKKYDSLKSDYELYHKFETTDEIKDLFNELIPKKENIIKMDSGLKFKYWHYLIEEKYHIFVGRDSKSNDYLSIKFAKQNDYWFHARGLPGSHVVLRVDNIKEGVPKDIIKKVASLAAFYSKAKTAGTVPVSYTFAKFVHKKKGMAPGKVLLTKEHSLLVKPQLPKSCILINE
jgi:predicted ribosome quality control (RQC) complex YloA/Tae2 family protein